MQRTFLRIQPMKAKRCTAEFASSAVLGHLQNERDLRPGLPHVLQLCWAVLQGHPTGQDTTFIHDLLESAKNGSPVQPNANYGQEQQQPGSGAAAAAAAVDAAAIGKTKRKRQEEAAAVVAEEDATELKRSKKKAKKGKDKQQITEQPQTQPQQHQQHDKQQQGGAGAATKSQKKKNKNAAVSDVEQATPHSVAGKHKTKQEKLANGTSHLENSSAPTAATGKKGPGKTPAPATAVETAEKCRNNEKKSEKKSKKSRD